MPSRCSVLEKQSRTPLYSPWLSPAQQAEKVSNILPCHASRDAGCAPLQMQLMHYALMWQLEHTSARALHGLAAEA